MNEIKNYKISLKNVRLSFPSIFEKANFDGVETKFEATFLIDKKTQKDQIDAINKTIKSFIVETELKPTVGKGCFKDGDEKDYDGYPGHMSFKATTNRRPVVIDRDKSLLVKEDEKVYAGCYVNAVVELWKQDNKFGKCVNANLLGVQFVKDGDPFTGSSFDMDKDFEMLEENDNIMETDPIYL